MLWSEKGVMSTLFSVWQPFTNASLSISVDTTVDGIDTNNSVSVPEMSNGLFCLTILGREALAAGISSPQHPE